MEAGPPLAQVILSALQDPMCSTDRSVHTPVSSLPVQRFTWRTKTFGCILRQTISMATGNPEVSVCLMKSKFTVSKVSGSLNLLNPDALSDLRLMLLIRVSVKDKKWLYHP